jgi:hypothetical protein
MSITDTAEGCMGWGSQVLKDPTYSGANLNYKSQITNYK